MGLRAGYLTAPGNSDKYMHVAIAEHALGKPMPIGAEVHHFNEDKLDNRPANLVICQDRAYHGLLHKRARIVRAGGNPNTQRICYHCKQLVALPDVNVSPRRRSDLCKACARAFLVERVRRHRVMGLCRSCDSPVAPGRTKCEQHLAFHALRNRAWRNRLPKVVSG